MMCIEITAKNEPVQNREKFKVVDIQETAGWIINVYDGIMSYVYTHYFQTVGWCRGYNFGESQ